jgi:hypothetical protein
MAVVVKRNSVAPRAQLLYQTVQGKWRGAQWFGLLVGTQKLHFDWEERRGTGEGMCSDTRTVQR